MACAEEQVGRLEKIFRAMGQEPKGTTCQAILGIIDESQEMLQIVEQRRVQLLLHHFRQYLQILIFCIINVLKTRLEKIFRAMGQEPKGTTCQAILGIIDESQELVGGQRFPDYRVGTGR
jgi:ferritin-like metal-binding protein YciE